MTDWMTTAFQQAFSAQHMGAIAREYRAQHRLSQEALGHLVGMTQPQVSRIENGAPMTRLDLLRHWARTLDVPADLLWFAAPHTGGEHLDRRTILRLVTSAGVSVALGALDAGDTAGDEALNRALWRTYREAPTKASVLPVVQHQLGQVTRRGSSCLVGDLFQLAGEILFDMNQYAQAAHCYTAAAQACRESGNYDMWACALTRHAYLALYDREPSEAAQLIELASDVVQKGDPALTTRNWVAAVSAQAHAELGDAAACHEALQTAETVDGEQNGAWLRFDASRTLEDRGRCLVALGDRRAEDTLHAALSANPGPRRTGLVYADLALAGVVARDFERVCAYSERALEHARSTKSAAIARRLAPVRPHVPPDLQQQLASI